jgi:hypothetical protein
MRTSFIVLIGAVVCLASGATTASAGPEQEHAQVPAVVSVADANIDQAKPPQGGGTQKPPAQTTKPKPRTPKLPVGFRFFGGFEAMSMAASDTFEAQGGSSMVIGYGAGAEVLNIWRKLFLRTGFSTGSVEGTRGFVIDGDFVSNGVPLTLGVRNFEIGVGWRDYLKKHPWMAWYVAGGLNIGTNNQESPDPESGDNDSASGNGFVGTFGLEFALQKKAKNPLVVGFEAAYRSVGGVLGDSGGSQGFGESDLGGFSIRGLVGIRIKR